jgi:3-phosphoshikimate 1-carboxyvinyltransferase
MRIEPASRIAGTLAPPPDKSISHRAALLAAMSEGSVRVQNYLLSGDTASTLAALGDLGAVVEERDRSAEAADLLIRGVGLRGARELGREIDVGNSGTLLRMLPGWLAGQGPGRWTIDGDASIRRRPVDRVAEPLRRMGAAITCRDGSLPPVIVEGSELEGIRYELPVASAQVKSCILLAGLLARGETIAVERFATRDHTELALEQAGVPVRVERSRPGAPATVTVEQVECLSLEELSVPGDFSSAAFFLVAATLIEGSELLISEVGVNPTRTGLLRVMRRMGAVAEVSGARSAGSEPVADLAVVPARLEATTVEPEEVPCLIDELPLVALLGAFASGITTVRGAQELRRKESDRIATVVEGLRALGAAIEQHEDGFTVEGTDGLRGGSIDAAGDHRLAMLGVVAGLASREGAEVRGFEAAAVSYPGFHSDVEALALRS